VTCQEQLAARAALGEPVDEFEEADR
jgi:hypothetical protein